MKLYRKLIRKMLYQILYDSVKYKKETNIFTIEMLDYFLNYLWMETREISLKDYFRYKKILEKVQSYDDDFRYDIISFKGMN